MLNTYVSALKTLESMGKAQECLFSFSSGFNAKREAPITGKSQIQQPQELTEPPIAS